MTITIKNLQNKIRIRPKKIRELVLGILAEEAGGRPGCINICFAGDKVIQGLNRRHLKKDSPTDVLAFEMSRRREAGIFADIAVSCETAVRNAAVFKTSPAFETHLYLVHGILHILGYRDDNPRRKKLMQQKAEHLLKKCLYKKARHWS